MRFFLILTRGLLTTKAVKRPSTDQAEEETALTCQIFSEQCLVEEEAGVDLVEAVNKRRVI
jgi:hypothetical protein